LSAGASVPMPAPNANVVPILRTGSKRKRSPSTPTLLLDDVLADDTEGRKAASLKRMIDAVDHVLQISPPHRTEAAMSVSSSVSSVSGSAVANSSQQNPSVALTCLQCSKEPRRVMFRSCSHVVCCKECADKLVSESRPCPLHLGPALTAADCLKVIINESQ